MNEGLTSQFDTIDCVLIDASQSCASAGGSWEPATPNTGGTSGFWHPNYSQLPIPREQQIDKFVRNSRHSSSAERCITRRTSCPGHQILTVTTDKARDNSCRVRAGIETIGYQAPGLNVWQNTADNLPGILGYYGNAHHGLIPVGGASVCVVGGHYHWGTGSSDYSPLKSMVGAPKLAQPPLT